jgi:hypothetical protein
MEIQIWKFKYGNSKLSELPLMNYRYLAWLAIVSTDIFRTCAWTVKNRVDDRTYPLAAPKACKHLAFGDAECVQSYIFTF